MRQHYPVGILALLAAVLMSAAGCSDNNPLAPFQPEISNAADNFQFQVTGVNGVTTTVYYTWQNSGTRASVNQACAISGGSATVTLFDADSVQVYTRDLKDNGTFESIAGVSSSWKIKVELVKLVGSLNFRAQKL